MNGKGRRCLLTHRGRDLLGAASPDITGREHAGHAGLKHKGLPPAEPGQRHICMLQVLQRRQVTTPAPKGTHLVR